MRKVIKKIRTFIYTFLAYYTRRNFKDKIKANGLTILTPDTITGVNVHFNGFRVYGMGKVSIGDNFHSGKNCILITDIHNYVGNKLPYDETIISKNINIKNNVWLGMNVTILGGVTIDEGAIIQAGSVVVNNIPRLAIAGGHPAKVFSYRDKDHYQELIDKKAYF